MSAARNAVPIPNATTRARLRVGSGDERQDRHELRVDGQQGHRRPGHPELGRRPSTWPAWTEAISSSVEAKIVAAAGAMNASFGWTTTPGRTATTAITTRTATAPTAVGRAAGATRRAPAPRPTAALVDGEQRR